MERGPPRSTRGKSTKSARANGGTKHGGNADRRSAPPGAHGRNAAGDRHGRDTEGVLEHRQERRGGPADGTPGKNADSRGTRQERRCGTTPANPAGTPMRRQPRHFRRWLISPYSVYGEGKLGNPRHFRRWWPPRRRTRQQRRCELAHPPALRAFLRTQKRQVQSIDPCPDRRS